MALQQIEHPHGGSRHVVTVPPDLPSQRFRYWDYAAESRELIHARSGHRIALDTALNDGDEIARCIFQVHDKPWGNAKVLAELIELLGTYFKGERAVAN